MKEKRFWDKCIREKDRCNIIIDREKPKKVKTTYRLKVECLSKKEKNKGHKQLQRG